ncbi:hypothetical protein SDC9_134985 [bioreactor metagenome]|uniref:Uncharacterized protein n=1 Tax=bioreactor metagenome TaxID=1076179 RepID=A0A645DF90_9ZZZZ
MNESEIPPIADGSLCRLAGLYHRHLDGGVHRFFDAGFHDGLVFYIAAFGCLWMALFCCMEKEAGCMPFGGSYIYDRGRTAGSHAACRGRACDVCRPCHALYLPGKSALYCRNGCSRPLPAAAGSVRRRPAHR